MKRSDATKHAKPRFGRHKQTIADRMGQNDFPIGIAWFQSTEAGGLVEATARSKNSKLAPPKRSTFVRPRARESRDLQKDAR